MNTVEDGVSYISRVTLSAFLLPRAVLLPRAKALHPYSKALLWKVYEVAPWLRTSGLPCVGLFDHLLEEQAQASGLVDGAASASPTQTIVVTSAGCPTPWWRPPPPTCSSSSRPDSENYPKGSPFTGTLRDLPGDSIFIADGRLWHSQRMRTTSMVASLSTWNNSLCPLPGGVPRLSRAVAAFNTASEIRPRWGPVPVFAEWNLKREIRGGVRGAILGNRDPQSFMEQVNSRKEEQLKGNVGRGDDLSRYRSGHAEEVVHDGVVHTFLRPLVALLAIVPVVLLRAVAGGGCDADEENLICQNMSFIHIYGGQRMDLSGLSIYLNNSEHENMGFKSAAASYPKKHKKLIHTWEEREEREDTTSWGLPHIRLK